MSDFAPLFEAAAIYELWRDVTHDPPFDLLPLPEQMRWRIFAANVDDHFADVYARVYDRRMTDLESTLDTYEREESNDEQLEPFEESDRTLHKLGVP